MGAASLPYEHGTRPPNAWRSPTLDTMDLALVRALPASRPVRVCCGCYPVGLGRFERQAKAECPLHRVRASRGDNSASRVGWSADGFSAISRLPRIDSLKTYG